MGILHAGRHIGPGEFLSGSHLLVDHIADVIFRIDHIGLLAEGRAEHIEFIVALCHGLIVVNRQVRHIFQPGEQANGTELLRISYKPLEGAIAAHGEAGQEVLLRLFGQWE